MTNESTPAVPGLSEWLGPNAPERRECDAPICPWCDRQGWDTCGSYYDTYACDK